MTIDEDLLRRYRQDRDETAFAAIVRKHGPMVLATCVRAARNRADSEDAFQATFLVLASRAESVRNPARLGAWLHGVALRCAKKARDSSRRMATGHDSFDSLPTPITASPEPDLSAVIDESLAAIPDTYRAAVVLCHLEGRTRAEAARELGWTEGTLSGRLHRALKLLGDHLSARGVTTAGVALVAVLSARSATATVPLPLVASTCSAAGLLTAGFPEPGRAASLASGVLRAMTFRRLKIAAVVLSVFGLGGVALLGGLPAPSAVAAPVPVEKKKDGWKKMVEVDHRVAVTAVAMNDDMLATAGEADNRCNLKLWNPKSGERLGLEVRGAWFTDNPTVLRFAAGGKYLMMVTPDGGISRYEKRAGGLVNDSMGTKEVLGFADDLSVLAIRDAKKPLTELDIHANLWEVKNAIISPMVNIMYPQKQAVVHADIAPDGSRLAVAHADSVIRLCGPVPKRPKEVVEVELPVKTDPTAVKLSHDGKRLAVLGKEGFARVYDAEKAEELCELTGHKETVAAVVFTPDGKKVATACGKTVRVFDAASGKLLSEFEAHTDDVTCLAFTPDGKKLVTGSKDKSAKVWERE
jgi:RNA polymerase sigma factor (sigma-70 family)